MVMELPFLTRLSVVLTSGATGRMNYAVSANEKLQITKIYQKSTGAFDIYGLSDSAGRAYTNASSGAGLDSNFIQDVDTSFIGFSDFPVPIYLEGGQSLSLDVIDTSAAGNTVEIMLVGKRILP